MIAGHSPSPDHDARPIADGKSRRHPGSGRRQATPHPKGRQIDPVALREVQALLGSLPRRRDLLIEHLHLIQDKYRCLSAPHLAALAHEMKLALTEVYEVATFYDMYNTVPVGRIQVRVCTTTPCWLCGSDDVVRACKDTLGVGIGESTPDGRFFLREFECLGACSNAPVLWIDDDFYEDIDYAGTKAVLETLMRGEKLKPGPQNGRTASMPLGGKTTLLDADG